MKTATLLERSQCAGVTRLADPTDRWWWATALVALVIGAVGVLIVLLRRYIESPTYVARVRSESDAFPFPAVLIYPQLLFLDHKMDEFIGEMSIPSTMNATRLRTTLTQLAAFVSPDVKFDVHDLVVLERVLLHNNMTPVQAIRRMLPECDQSILRCGWRGSFVNCSDLFTMELTGDGYACVFNGRSLIREMAEGVDPRSKPYTSQWYTNVVGSHNGLSIVVDQRQTFIDVDLAYKWLALNVGGGFVDVSLNGTALTPGQEVWAGFINHRITVSPDARNLRSDLRRCRLEHEENLRYFPIYTRRYCQLECEMRRARRRCGCVKAAHPREPDVPSCHAVALGCARRAAVAVDDDCACTPACDFNYEEVTIQSFDLETEHYSYNLLYSKGLELSSVTVVRAFALVYDAPWYERRPVYDFLNLFSNLGGVFNIYVGCSILTILEVVIFLRYYIGSKFNNLKRNTQSNFRSEEKRTSNKVM